MMLLTTRDNNTSIFVYFSKSGIQNSKSGIASFWKAPVQGHLFLIVKGVQLLNYIMGYNIENWLFMAISLV